MAGANSQMSLVGLDFDIIKNNLKTYLKSQDTFKDYNFDGSGLSILLDVLAYNTQYNAFYLNMVANEMFLDTALQRPSVISHAKLLDYTPSSYIAPTAYIDIVVNNVNESSLTLPQNTIFMSEAMGESKLNYTFVTVDSTTVNSNTISKTATFSGVELRQGVPVKQTFTVNSTSNPSYTFEIPDADIDTSTIKVTIQKSVNDTTKTVYTYAKNYLLLNGNSEVFFLQESLRNTYEIYFGDGVIGKKLTDGNLVIVEYIITQGGGSYGANNFTLMSAVSGFTDYIVYGSVPASQGKSKENIDSIKYQAVKSYAAQNRAVTKEDYITIIQQNSIGLSFDAVNVWGGQENDPPVYGQSFICIKPQGTLTLTDNQKNRLINDVIRPVSLVTVEPKIIDPDYTFLKFDINVIYDPSKTSLTSGQLKGIVSNTVVSFCNSTLNSFNSIFSESDLNHQIKISEPSIIANEISVTLQKKFYPNLTTPTTYKLYFDTELQKGILTSGVNSYPSFKVRNTLNLSEAIDGVYIEEIPSNTGGVESINIINPGYGYQFAPTITILGDGSGAEATATINTNGTLNSIKIISTGKNYTSAIVKITPSEYDTTGKGASATVNLEGRYGTLRTFYYNDKFVKSIINSNAGTIDYKKGIITLNSFNPLDTNDSLGQLVVFAKPVSSILSSSKNKMLVLDPNLNPNDTNVLNINIIAQSK